MLIPYTRRVTRTSIQGTFEFTDYDDDKKKIFVSGVYEISTIPSYNAWETILFRVDGTGPEQIELWYSGKHPTTEQVIELLKNGKFYGR